MEGYFIRLSKQTPTKFWINNPTRKQTTHGHRKRGPGLHL